MTTQPNKSVEPEIKYSQEVFHDQAGEYESRINIAHKRPRDLKKVLNDCVDEADLSGDLFFYNWSVKSKQKDGNYKTEVIEGQSYHLAKSAARNFGNCDVGMLPVIDLGDAWIFTGRFIDFENNASITRQFRQSKGWIVYGNIDPDRKDDIRFQIGQSKCLRNVILAAVPEMITDKMLIIAKQAVRNKIDERIAKAKGNIDVVKNDILEAFEKYGISREMIEKKFDLEYKAWDARFLAGLSGDLSALHHAAETPDTLYGEFYESKVDRLNEKLNAKNGKAGAAPAETEKPKQEPPPEQEIPPPAESEQPPAANKSKEARKSPMANAAPEKKEVRMMTDMQLRGINPLLARLEGKLYFDQNKLTELADKICGKKLTFIEASSLAAELDATIKENEGMSK